MVIFCLIFCLIFGNCCRAVQQAETLKMPPRAPIASDPEPAAETEEVDEAPPVEQDSPTRRSSRVCIWAVEMCLLRYYIYKPCHLHYYNNSLL